MIVCILISKGSIKSLRNAWKVKLRLIQSKPQQAALILYMQTYHAAT